MSIHDNSVFAKHRDDVYQYLWSGTLHLETMAGGVPSDPKVAESWLKTKIEADDDAIRALVAETMMERGVSTDEAIAEIANLKVLTGFKRSDEGQLYYEGRNLKAAIKEGSNIRWPKGKWGPSNKGTKGFFAEHVFVLEDQLPLGRSEPDAIVQRFVKARYGAAIKNEEVVRDVKIDFTVATDHKFTTEQWAHLWLTIESNGVGAARSQGYGKCALVRWERIK